MPTQNGVDAPERLGALLGAAHVVGGYTRVTSLLQGAGGVNHTAIHPALQGTGALPTSGDWVPAELQRCAAAWNVRARQRAAAALTPRRLSSPALPPSPLTRARDRSARPTCTCRLTTTCCSTCGAS